MKYCFVGVGSIAKKHIANIRRIDSEAVVHAFRTGHSNYTDLDKIIDKQFFSFDELDEKYDVVFITNPTSFHYETLNQFYSKSECFFIEKPVFSHFKDQKDINAFRGKKTYVAAPLRFCSGISYAKKLIDEKGKPNCIRVISSSYLPEWRPNVDYRNTYSAHMNMGGGVHIDLIHELDYIVYLVGCPKKSLYINDKVSNLDIDSYDISSSIHKIDNTIAEIHLDYFGRDKKRVCELYYNDSTYYIDLINNIVVKSCNGESVTISLEASDMYLKEMDYFYKFIKSNIKVSINDIELANNVLKIINEGEK